MTTTSLYLLKEYKFSKIPNFFALTNSLVFLLVHPYLREILLSVLNTMTFMWTRLDCIYIFISKFVRFLCQFNVANL